MGKRKFRGHDPAEAARRAYEARRNPAAWGTNDEALRLEQNKDVHTTAETRAKTRRVQRFDCFQTLSLEDGQLTSVRRYQYDLAESNGVGDRDLLSEAVDGSAGARELVTGRMMAASSRLLDLHMRLHGRDRALLKALSFPVWVEGRQANWKEIVRKLRGLIDRDSQSQAVKTLAEAVRVAYAEIDQGVRRAA